jgi:hypothetical protein
MPKKTCCCNESDEPIKHYIAIPCYEFNLNTYIEPKYHKLFGNIPNVLSLPGPTAPFKLVAPTEQPGFYITADNRRQLKAMLKGGGGGARGDATGGNAAYIDFRVIPFSSYSFLCTQLGGGGTGPEPGDFDINLGFNFLVGGAGYPLAGWGGGGAGFGYSVNEPKYIAGGGGGAGGQLGSAGGHGGTEFGEAGSNDSTGVGGEGGSQNAGGTSGGLGALNGSFIVGGRGNAQWGLPPWQITPTNGGGGGSGKFGGGGGYNSAGGGGSSTIGPDSYGAGPVDLVIDGNDRGPGNRCSPYFTLNYDPGLGAQRTGRHVAGITFETQYDGANSQSSVYFRTKWCPCFEQQVDFTNDSTGPIPETPLHICLNQTQYDSIISNLPAGSPPPLENVRVSFEINGQKYLLVQEDPTTQDPTTGHYYCSLGCENDFIVQGDPTNVKWYIPSSNFLCLKDSVEWFKDNFGVYDFSNVTTCCDCFIGLPICAPGELSCAGIITPEGGAIGCLCPRIPPEIRYKCYDPDLDPTGPYVSLEPESNWIYLCIPAICWRYFGPDELTRYYECKIGSEIVKSEEASLPNTYGTPSSLDKEALTDEFCGGQYLENDCKEEGQQGAINCKFLVSNLYPFRDPWAINAPIIVSSESKICSRTLFGYSGAPEPPCQLDDYGSITVDSSFSFRLGYPNCEGNCDQYCSPGPCDCPDSFQCFNSTTTTNSQITAGNNGYFYNTPLTKNYVFSKFKKGLEGFVSFVNSSMTITKNRLVSLIYNTETGLLEEPNDGFSIIRSTDETQTTSFNKSQQTNNLTQNCPQCPCTEDGYICTDETEANGECTIIPTLGCNGANFVAFKWDIVKQICPPSDWKKQFECPVCSPCFPEIDYISCWSWEGSSKIIEKQSWFATNCLLVDESEVGGTEVDNALTITFPGCLFNDLFSNEEKIAKARSLVGWDPIGAVVQVALPPPTGSGLPPEIRNIICGKLTICALSIDVFSGNGGYIAQKINQCLNPYKIRAVGGSPSYWFTHRLMFNDKIGAVVKEGDDLYLLDGGTVWANGEVSIAFGAFSKGWQACSTIMVNNVCNGTDECGLGTGLSSTSDPFYGGKNVSTASYGVNDKFILVPSSQFGTTETRNDACANDGISTDYQKCPAFTRNDQGEVFSCFPGTISSKVLCKLNAYTSYYYPQYQSTCFDGNGNTIPCGTFPYCNCAGTSGMCPQNPICTIAPVCIVDTSVPLME